MNFFNFFNKSIKGNLIVYKHKVSVARVKIRKYDKILSQELREAIYFLMQFLETRKGHIFKWLLATLITTDAIFRLRRVKNSPKEEFATPNLLTGLLREMDRHPDNLYAIRNEDKNNLEKIEYSYKMNYT